MLSDRGASLLSAIFKEMCKIYGIKQIYTTAYNPKCNGAIERFHHTLDNMLALIARDHVDNWD